MDNVYEMIQYKSKLDIIQSLLEENAALKEENTTLKEQQTMLEDCILEMGQAVYA